MPDVTNDELTNDSNGSGLSLTRRRALVGAAWTAPVIVVATAAPAMATSAQWTITSTSYEGTSAGVRDNNATYQFRFSISVPTGSTVTAPQAVFTFNPAGNGTVITGVNPTGTVDGWSFTGSVQQPATSAYHIFTASRGNIVGPATVTLNFTMLQVSGPTGATPDAPPASVAFSSTSPTFGPPTNFTINGANGGASPGYITTPPA